MHVRKPHEQLAGVLWIARRFALSSFSNHVARGLLSHAWLGVSLTDLVRAKPRIATRTVGGGPRRPCAFSEGAMISRARGIMTVWHASC
ncbi:hypothetical protein ACVI1K_001154 [Bradyrhizobium sp. USDA 4508]